MGASSSKPSDALFRRQRRGHNTKSHSQPAWTFDPPLEILEAILVLAYHGDSGLMGGSKLLQQARKVNRTWYAVCARIMQSYVVLRHRSDLRLFRPDLFHTDIVDRRRQGAEAPPRSRPSSWPVERPRPCANPRSKLWQRIQLGGKGQKRTQQVQQIQAVREWTIDIMSNPAQFLQGSLCHSLECQMDTGLIISVISWSDVAELLRYLPNLRFFGLRSNLAHPGLFSILEELSDKVPDPNSDGDNAEGRPTIERPHRKRLERIELSFNASNYQWTADDDVYYHPPFTRMRPGYSLGVTHLSLDMGRVPADSTALLLSQCRPGTLRSLRISGPCPLVRGKLGRSLAAHASSLTHLILGAGRPEWSRRQWIEWSIVSSLGTWEVAGFLKKRPMDALRRLEIEGGPKYDGRFLQSPAEAGVEEQHNRSQLWDELKGTCDGLGIDLVALPLLPPRDGPH